MHLSNSIGRIVAIFRKKPEEGEQIGDNGLKAKRLEEIRSKMRSGKRLSNDERDFLRIKSLNLEKANKIEKERDEFRRALANCKTKEEARQLKTSKSMELQIEASATSDSEFIVMRMMTIFDEFVDFSESEKYADIPDDDDGLEYQLFLMQRIEEKNDS